MTRDEAKQTFTVHTNDSDRFIRVDKRTFDKFIERIYDDSESRTCGNCKFCNFDVENKQTFHKGYCTQLLHPVHLNFGCIKFERLKDDNPTT